MIRSASPAARSAGPRAGKPPFVPDPRSASPDPAPGPAPRAAGPPVHDRVTAVHDTVDFARALVAGGGTQTAGLTMIRGEVQAVALELRRLREEVALLRADGERVRLDLLQLGQFTRGLLVDRLAARFARIDGDLSALRRQLSDDMPPE
jgi:hypothetical protein